MVGPSARGSRCRAHAGGRVSPFDERLELLVVVRQRLASAKSRPTASFAPLKRTSIRPSSTDTPAGRPDRRASSASMVTGTRIPVSRAFRISVTTRSRRDSSPRKGGAPAVPAELAQEPGDGQHGSFDYTTTRGGWERKELRMKDVIALLNDKRSELLDSVVRIDAAIAALGVKPRPPAPSRQPAKRRRREMSAETKQAVSDRDEELLGGTQEG